jgi:hypothetical protein
MIVSFRLDTFRFTGIFEIQYKVPCWYSEQGHCDNLKHCDLVPALSVLCSKYKLLSYKFCISFKVTICIIKKYQIFSSYYNQLSLFSDGGSVTKIFHKFFSFSIKETFIVNSWIYFVTG